MGWGSLKEDFKYRVRPDTMVMTSGLILSDLRLTLMVAMEACTDIARAPQPPTDPQQGIE